MVFFETQAAIETFFKRHYSELCYFADRMISDRDAAEDVVQDVFLKFFKAKARFENEDAAKGYLYLSVRNACLNRKRHEKVHDRYMEAMSAQEHAWDPPAIEAMIRAEVLGRVQMAIEELPPGCRSVLKLSFYESLRNDEIAERLGVSVNTVKTQKARAIKLLRIRLDPAAFLCMLLFLDF